jgi:hypothetical protein
LSWGRRPFDAVKLAYPPTRDFDLTFELSFRLVIGYKDKLFFDIPKNN